MVAKLLAQIERVPSASEAERLMKSRRLLKFDGDASKGIRRANQSD